MSGADPVAFQWTITGVSRYIKNTKGKKILSVAVEPIHSPVITQKRNGQPLAPGPHKIQGIGAGFVPSIYREQYVDEVIAVPLADAIATTRDLARREGILNGISSGAIAFAAIQVAKRLGTGKRVVALIPSNGERYLSTLLFEDLKVEGLAGAVL